MSRIEISDYQSLKLLELKKVFIFSSLKPSASVSIVPCESSVTAVQYLHQKIVIIIDLTLSMYSYHMALQDLIYNSILKTMRTLVKGLYSAPVSLEVSIFCTRMAQSPLRVIVQSYIIEKMEDYHELMSLIKYNLSELNMNYFSNAKEEVRNIKFNTVLKWSLFALEMMQNSALPMVILLTNTVDSYVSSAIYDGLVMQYCRNEVAFNVVSLCDSEGLRFGLSSDLVALKDAAKATGGNFIKAKDLESCIPLLFSRKIFEEKNHSHKFLVEEYSTNLEVPLIVDCRLREGFSIWKIDHFISFGLYCGNNTKIEYNIIEKGTYSVIQIFLITNLNIVKKIEEKLKSSPPNIKGSEPAFYERIAWVIHNIKETENFSLTISKVIRGLETITEKILEKNVNVWHRWLEIERIDIVTSKQKSDFFLLQGQKKLIDCLKKYSKTFENDTFLEISENSLVIGKVIWEGANKAVLFIGGFRENPLITREKIYDLLKKNSIEVYKKPLGRMLVENIFDKKCRPSLVQSVKTYKPHPEALKAFLLKKCNKYSLLTSNWAPAYLNLINELLIKKGFFYLLNCVENKTLFCKPYKIKEKNPGKIYFLQHFLYANKNVISIEFYADPELIKNEELYEDIQKSIESVCEYLYRSFYALEYLIFKCIRHKLNDEDLCQEDDFDEKIVNLSHKDDFFCYVSGNEAGNNFKEEKKRIIEEMSQKNLMMGDLPTDPPSIMILYKHSNHIEIDLEIFDISPLEKKNAVNIYGKLYQNLLSAYSDICDFCITEQGMHHYIRYLSTEAVLIWTLPNLDEFMTTLVKTSGICMNLYECNLSKIDHSNVEPVKLNSEFIQNQILSKNIFLIKRTYKSVVNFTYCEVFDLLKFNPKSLELIISSCKTEKKLVNITNLFNIMKVSWDSIYDLSKNICQNSIFILENSFALMDSKFSEFLAKAFEKISDTNFYLFKDRKKSIFLQFGNTNGKLSFCLNDSVIEFTLFKSPFSNFFHKKIGGLKTEKESIPCEVLQKISETAVSLLSKQALYLLSKKRPVTDKTIDDVFYHFSLISEKVVFKVSLDLIIRKQDFSELIHSELKKNKVLFTQKVNDFYFFVSTDIDKNFFLKSDYEKDSCPLENKDNSLFSIDFWVILEVIPENSLKFTYFFPEELEFPYLTSQSIKFEITKRIKLLENRVNQRILLKNLLETGKISSMLWQPEVEPDAAPLENKKVEENKKVLESRIWLQKQNDTMRRKSSLKPQGSYKLQLQYSHDVQITDRLVKSDVTKALSSKFSKPPYSIDNLEEAYMLIQSEDVWVFRFVEVQRTVQASHQGISKSMPHDKGVVNVRYTQIQIFGIDPPPDDIKTKLEKIVEEILQETSLAKLASLLKNGHKKLITDNDNQFIRGTTPADIVMYPIPTIVSDYDFFLSITKKILMRFLSPFKLMDSTVLVYNYLTVIDSNYEDKRKNQYRQLSKNTNGPENTFEKNLGNIFGKSLALINLYITYFDGEEIHYKSETNTNDENLMTKLQIESEVKLLEKFCGQSTPSSTGYYLEVNISKNWKFNTSAFIEQLDSSISESIFEYIIEKIITNNWYPNPSDNYLFISECSLIPMKYSLMQHEIDIKHFLTWSNIFLFFSQVIHMTEELIYDKIKLRYAFEGPNERISTLAYKEIEEHWEKLKKDHGIGSKVKLSFMGGPEFISSNTSDELKFYVSEQIGETYMKRSIFIYIEVDNMNLRVSTYNVNKDTLQKLHDNIQSHVNWTRKRYLLLNKALMNKLGLFYHDFMIKDSKASPQKDNMSAMLQKPCSFMEFKENDKKYMLESLINPLEVSHNNNNFEENCLDFEVKGAYSLIRYEMANKKSNEKENKKDKEKNKDLVRIHGLYISSLSDKKSEHSYEFEICKRAFMKWCKEKRLSYYRSIMIKAQMKLHIRDDVDLVKRLLKSCHMFYKGNAKFYIQSNGQGKNKNSQYILCEVLKSYTDKITKITKFENPIETNLKCNRKNSAEDLENPVKYVQKYYSSGTLLNEQKNEVMQSFLIKDVNQSLIIIEIWYENNVVATNGYCIEDLYKLHQSFRFKDEIEGISTLTKELSKLRYQLDSTLILYDIQIKCITNFFLNPKEFNDIDLVKTLNSIVKDFITKPLHSLNSVNAFDMDLKDDETVDLEKIFRFFILSAEECGFTSIKSGIKAQCAYKRTEEKIENELTNTYGRWFVYTLSNSRSDVNPNKLVVRCFIVKLDELGKNKNNDWKKVKPKAQKEFDQAITKCKEYYRRDQLWEKIKANNVEFTIEDLKSLLEASKVKNMFDIDPRIKYLTSFKNVFTDLCIDYLFDVHKNSAIKFNMGEKVCLIIKFSERNLAQLILNKDEQSLQMFSVTRSTGFYATKEEDSITQLINQILQWLWVRIITN